jgi:hypothetical protein
MLRTKVTVLAVLFCVACGGGRTYTTTGVGGALSADARIDVTAVRGGNRQVRVAVQHLPPPDRLGSGLSTYGVWIVPPGGTPVPAGRLDYDPGSRRGQLTTVTPYEDFRIIVSAEPSMPAGYPSHAIVVSQDVSS